MSSKTSVTEDDALVPLKILREGDAVAFRIIIPDVQTSLASPVSEWYKLNSGSNLASTYLTGSDTVSGIDTIITKTTTSLKAGEWMLCVTATVDGQAQTVIQQPILVKRRNQL